MVIYTGILGFPPFSWVGSTSKAAESSQCIWDMLPRNCCQWEGVAKGVCKVLCFRLQYAQYLFCMLCTIFLLPPGTHPVQQTIPDSGPVYPNIRGGDGIKLASFGILNCRECLCSVSLCLEEGRFVRPLSKDGSPIKGRASLKGKERSCDPG